MTFTPSTDELIERNAAYATERHDPRLAAQPGRRLAVVTCMDARIDPLAVLGLDNGDAHIMRNAGGVVTDDVIRSLCLSQRALGTREIVLVHHTACGLQGVDEARFRAELAAELGITPPWALEGFTDPHDDVRQSIARLVTNPFIAHSEHIRGFVYDVDTGRLSEVDAAGTVVGGRQGGRPA